MEERFKTGEVGDIEEEGGEESVGAGGIGKGREWEKRRGTKETESGRQTGLKRREADRRWKGEGKGGKEGKRGGKEERMEEKGGR